MTDAIVKVLIVEDSLSVQLVLTQAIESDPRLRVMGSVHSGEQALEFVKTRKPDVILMDIHLPGINGFETTRQIMATTPLPIVICSSVADPNDIVTTFQAVEAGALAFVAKPAGPLHPEHASVKQHLVETVKLMAEVKVVRRWARPTRSGSRPPLTPAPARMRPAGGLGKLVAIGTSTGGPPVLRTILSELPGHLPAPILVVQHIAPGFLPGLVEWLGTSSALPMHIATHDAPLLPGHVYFAPDGHHLGVNPHGHIALEKRAAHDGLCPSVARLFRSVAAVYGIDAIGVLLTGMGKDGALELALLKQCGATTIAQDKATSVVHGMPGEAIRIHGATHVLGAHEVAGELRRILFPI